MPQIEESKYSTKMSSFHRDCDVDQGNSINKVSGCGLNDRFSLWEGQATGANTYSVAVGLSQPVGVVVKQRNLVLRESFDQQSLKC